MIQQYWPIAYTPPDIDKLKLSIQRDAEDIIKPQALQIDTSKWFSNAEIKTQQEMWKVFTDIPLSEEKRIIQYVNTKFPNLSWPNKKQVALKVYDRFYKSEAQSLKTLQQSTNKYQQTSTQNENFFSKETINYLFYAGIVLLILISIYFIFRYIYKNRKKLTDINFLIKVILILLIILIIKLIFYF